LIIVDDASTDGTFEQVEALMRRDGRVSCLQHPRRVGLPAISLCEAFLRSRGAYLLLGLDDVIFDPDAVSALLAAARAHPDGVVHGRSTTDDADDLPYEYLASGDFLGQSNVLIPRHVVDDIGFIDPHIAIACFNGWDLWRRIRRSYPIIRCDIEVAHDIDDLPRDRLDWHRPARSDVVQQYLERPRNPQLKPDALLDANVWSVPRDSSACLADHIIRSRQSFADMPWTASAAPLEPGDAEILLAPSGRAIAIATTYDLCTTLYIDGIPAQRDQSLLFIDPRTDDAAIALLVSCSDAVILVRQLFGDFAQRVIIACRRIGVPIYYLVDANFILLRHEVPDCAPYTKAAVTSALADFSGVICTSRILADYYQFNQIHPSVHVIGPVFDPIRLHKQRRLAPSPSAATLRIGFIGGDFRRHSLHTDVIPALAHLCPTQPLELMSRTAIDHPDDLPFRVTSLPFTDSTDRFLLDYRGVDVVVHPRGKIARANYTTSSVLLSSLYLGAVPLVASEPAFRGLTEDDGVLVVRGGQVDWEAALTRARSVDLRQRLLGRLEAFCKANYSPDPFIGVLNGILDRSPPVTLTSWGDRIRRYPLDQASQAINPGIQIEQRTRENASLQSRLTGAETEVAQKDREIATLTTELRDIRRSSLAWHLRLASRAIGSVWRRTHRT
jgi:hypothetical protein